MVFCPEALVLAAARGLQQHARLLDDQQAPHGLDAMAELDLHPLVRQGFAAGGLGVLAEWPYPSHLPVGPESQGAGGRTLPRHPRDRLRCDVVVLPEAGAKLVDPIAARIEAERTAESAPLFAGLETADPGGVAGVGGPEIGPESAFWLEIKTIGQFTYSAGVPGPNRTYAPELLATAADVAKLAGDPVIRRGGLLLVLFTADRATAEHDLGVFARRCHDRGLPISAAAMEGFAIVDRIGNGWCQVALVPVSC